MATQHSRDPDRYLYRLHGVSGFVVDAETFGAYDSGPDGPPNPISGGHFYFVLLRVPDGIERYILDGLSQTCPECRYEYLTFQRQLVIEMCVVWWEEDHFRAEFIDFMSYLSTLDCDPTQHLVSAERFWKEDEDRFLSVMEQQYGVEITVVMEE